DRDRPGEARPFAARQISPARRMGAERAASSGRARQPGEFRPAMITPLHQPGTVVENVRLARDTYRIRIEAPEIAAAIVPGQFVMVRVPDRSDPLLGRPFAFYDTVLDASGRPVGIDIVYLVVGKLTSLLAGREVGDRLEIWGPLGHGFRDLTGRRQVAL